MYIKPGTQKLIVRRVSKMDALDCVWNGTGCKDEDHLKTLHSLFESNFDYYMGSASFDKAFEGCTSDLERIKEMRKYFVWTPVPASYFERFNKSEQSSNYFRERALESFRTEKYKLALRGFNLAIAFARTGEQELGIGFLERAKFMANIQEHVQTIRDINLARQNKCREELLENIEENNMIGKWRISPKENGGLDFEKETKARFFQLSYPSQLEHAEDFVEMEWTADRGRKLIVTKDVTAGEKLLVQKPFAAVLKNYLSWDTEHCNFCFKPILGGVPCALCTFALYCDEACREKSSTGDHKYEHRYISYLHCTKAPLRDLLAARIICKLGPGELFRLFQNQNSNLYQVDGLPGFDENGSYRSSQYLPIYHLVTHPSHLRSLERVSNSFRALIITHLLEETSEFFDQLSLEQTPGVMAEFKDFVASLILHHIENIPYNAISLSKLKVHEDFPNPKHLKGRPGPPDLESDSYAMAMFSLLAICNHSCDPNSVPLRRPHSQRVSLITLKTMKAGDEVLISYAPLFTSMETVERRKYLSKRYNFTCNCNACASNWFVDASQVLNIFTAGVNEVCSITKLQRRGKKSEILKLRETLEQVETLISAGDYIEGIDTLKPCLGVLTTKFSSVFPMTLYAQELLKRTLILLVSQKK